MKKLKVLVLDCETAPMLAYIWDLRDEGVTLDRLRDDWHIMSWAAKWLGEKKVFYRDQRAAKVLEDDREILKELWQLLDEADVVITQNGVNFDTPKLNARFILHGMPPPSPYRHLDTYQIVKRVARFSSNKLEYLTAKLCKKYKKLPHKKFPGFSLWKECLAGNRKAWEEMRVYNIHDVLATEELYTKIRAWAPETMPDVYQTSSPALECRVCGEAGSMQRRGMRVTKKSQFARYQCQKCGSWSTGEKLKEIPKAA